MEKSFDLSRFLTACAALVIIFAGIKVAGEIVVPFLLALFIAIICSPIVHFLTKRKVPHWLAISLLFVVISGVFFFLIGLINGAVQEFTQSIPVYRQLISQKLFYLTALSKQFHLPLEPLREQIAEYLDPSVVVKFTGLALLGLSGVVSHLFLLILVVVFMLAEAPNAKYKIAALFSGKNYNTRHEVQIDRILQGIMQYLGVKTIISLLTGVLVFMLLKVAGVQYAILWATLSFLLNYIPNIGSVIAAVPIIVQVLLLNGLPTFFGVSLGMIAINVIIGNVLEPKMMGNRLGLSTLVVFLSLLFWGWLLGTVGMLLSVPLTMVLKIILEAQPNTLKYAALLGDIEKSETVSEPLKKR